MTRITTPYLRFCISFLLLSILLTKSALGLGELFSFDDNHRETTFNTLTITFIDVSENDRSCIFKINGKTVVIQRHETYDFEDVSIWIKNAYPVRDQSGSKDICLAIISGAKPIKREVVETKPEKKYTASQQDATLNTTDTLVETLGNNTVEITTNNEDTSPRKENIFYRFMRWIAALVR